VQSDSGNEANAQAQVPQPAAVGQTTDKPATPAAANAATPANAATTDIPVANAGKVENGAPQNTAGANVIKQGDQVDTSQSNIAQSDTPKNVAAQGDVNDPSLDDAGKITGVTNSAAKGRAFQTDALADKDGKSDAARSGAPETAGPQPDVQNIAGTPKSAPQPAPATIFDINSIVAPQAQSSPAAAATANLHIQVSAHASPDLPALAVEIVAKSQSGARQFDIRLDPPELGRVEVRLSIDASGKASAHLSADQPQTLSLLQKDAPILTRALRDAGLDVSQNGLNFSLRQQGENLNGSAGNNARRGSSRGLPLVATVSIDATGGSAAYRGLANGRLDIRV
jgi:flagellar hook-length control protein FliK